MLANDNGNGKHLEMLTKRQLINYWKVCCPNCLAICSLLVGPLRVVSTTCSAMTTIKLSVLLFYRRIFSTPQFQRPLYAVGALVIAWPFTSSLSTALQCVPPNKYWGQEIEGHCLDALKFFEAIRSSSNRSHTSCQACLHFSILLAMYGSSVTFHFK